MDYDALPHFRLFVPYQSSGANLIYFDLFNASGSARDVLVKSITPIVSGANAVSGVVAVDLFLNRTTAVGTGGTAATYEGTAFTACTISPMGYGSTKISTSITARFTPSGGATAGAVISWASVFTEETSAASYFSVANELVRRGQLDNPPLVVPQGTGISVVQGSVASVGTTGFDVIFAVKQK